MKRLYGYIAVLGVTLATCTSCRGTFSKEDKALIFADPQELMHVLVVDDPKENEVLRTPSGIMSRRALKSEAYRLLVQRMSVTVQDSTVGGVGIAGPQVGINKRLVVVQRFDKVNAEAEAPFIAYPNIRIVSYGDARQTGPEGCLSVPGRSEQVSRAEQIVISYTDPATLKEVRETVEGYTAVIFQHEVDHLEGIIYTDRL